MKSLKNHLSVIFPLFVLLFSLQFTVTIDRMVKEYSAKLTEDYSIVVVAKKTVDESLLRSRVSGIKSVEPISSKNILDRLKENISSKNIALLKVALPKFYSIKLETFPSMERIEEIKKNLLKSSLIDKVETFSKTHTKVYRMFIMLKSIAFIFSGFILIVSMLLMAKQMRIWLLEHKERMAIMTLFGAPFWMKSAVLYRHAILDSFVASFLVSLVYMYIPKNRELQSFTAELGVGIPSFEILKDSGVLLVVSLAFSLVIVSLVIRKMNKE